MTKTFVFPPYENDPNYPTYALRQHILNGPEEIRVLMVKIASRVNGATKLERHLAPKMEGFFSIDYQDTFREMLMRDWISCTIHWISWTSVLRMLQGKQLEQEPTNIDMLTVVYFETIPGIWQTIALDAKEGGDQALKDWALESIVAWITSAEQRTSTTSPTSTFIRACFDIVIKSIKWEDLAESLKE